MQDRVLAFPLRRGRHLTGPFAGENRLGFYASRIQLGATLILVPIDNLRGGEQPLQLRYPRLAFAGPAAHPLGPAPDSVPLRLHLPLLDGGIGQSSFELSQRRRHRRGLPFRTSRRFVCCLQLELHGLKSRIQLGQLAPAAQGPRARRRATEPHDTSLVLTGAVYRDPSTRSRCKLCVPAQLDILQEKARPFLARPFKPNSVRQATHRSRDTAPGAWIDGEQHHALLSVTAFQPRPDHAYSLPVPNQHTVQKRTEVRLDGGAQVTGCLKYVSKHPDEPIRGSQLVQQLRDNGRQIPALRQHRGQTRSYRAGRRNLALELGDATAFPPVPLPDLLLGRPSFDYFRLEIGEGGCRPLCVRVEFRKLAVTLQKGLLHVGQLGPPPLQLSSPLPPPLADGLTFRLQRTGVPNHLRQCVEGLLLPVLDLLATLSQPFDIRVQLIPALGATCQLRCRFIDFITQPGDLGLDREAPARHALGLETDALCPRLGRGDPLPGEKSLALQFLRPRPGALELSRDVGSLPLTLHDSEPQVLGLGLPLAQKGFLFGLVPAAGLEIRFRFFQLLLHGAKSHVGNGHLELEAAVPQLVILAGTTPLAAQRPDLGAHLSEDIFETIQIVRCLVQSPESRAPPVLVAADLGRFLEQRSPLFGAVRQDRVDHPRFDDRIGIRPEAGVATQIVDVLEPATRPVQLIVGFSTPQQGPPDHNFRVWHGQDPVLVGQREHYLGPMNRLALRGALENGLLHPAAPDRCRTLLSQHPAQRIGDVGLATAVRSHDGRNSLVNRDLGLVGERLEAVKGERFDLHLGSPLLVTSVTARPASANMLSAGPAAASDSNAPE